MLTRNQTLYLVAFNGGEAIRCMWDIYSGKTPFVNVLTDTFLTYVASSHWNEL